MTIAGITLSAAVCWMIAAALLALLEALTLGLTSIWFAGGAVAASVTAMLGGGILVQVIVFLAVSGILLAATRPLVKRKLNDRTEKTNADALVGKDAVVEETVSFFEPGAVRLEGKVWTASCREGEIIPEGSVVKVLEIRGVTLLVEKQSEREGGENSCMDHQ